MTYKAVVWDELSELTAEQMEFLRTRQRMPAPPRFTPLDDNRYGDEEDLAPCVLCGARFAEDDVERSQGHCPRCGAQWVGTHDRKTQRHIPGEPDAG